MTTARPASSAPSDFDPITLEILWSRLISTVDEAAIALVRTSFSTIVRESNDFGTVLMDANGDSLAESTFGIPSFMGTMPRTLKHVLARYPVSEWRPGDHFITNDPWIATGHLPDITMLAPIFYKDRLVAFSGTTAHSPDIGGSLWGADCRELYEEGLRIPPIRFMAGGEPNRDVFDFILANVRVSEQVMGDLYSQVSANQVCARRLAELLEDSGLDDLSGLSEALQSRAEGAMRRAIEAVPDGTYRYYLDADGFDDDETHIQCAITVAGSEMTIDYAGTSKQIERGLNAVMNFTYAYSVYSIKCALDPFTPRNEGSYRSITVDAPVGSILNPRFPAPCNARQLTGHLLADVIYGCLAQAIPEKVIAESGAAPTLRALFSGQDRRGNRFSQILFASGGMGASDVLDGNSATAFPTNTGAGSLEVLESLAPIVIWQRELRTDSGGAGKHRGGLGQAIELEVVSARPLRLSLLSDRIKYAPRGLLGGGEGGRVCIQLGDGTTPHPKSRGGLEPGDRLILHYGGGAGYGDPHQRNPEAVRADVRNGYVSAEAARRDYGIEI
jgi:N-methylhydantoinase B